MGKIAVLDKTTIDKIAAGEVVERPASVVKELTENALDAGATMITVELKEGGTGLIRITDNGAGFAREDIPVAFLRHSTSKIRTVEELLTAGSLGFRGEALSSISAVAQVELITKQKSDFSGNRYVIEGGEEKEFTEAGCPDGTTFLVRNLFYNVPARRKFLKSATTEAGYCSELMQRMALCRPDTAFKFISNGKIVFQTSGNDNLKETIYQLFGREITANVSETEHFEKTSGIRVSGFVGKPLIARGNRNYENYFINGRYIRSNIIGKAIEEAYRPYIMQHKYPFTALHITMEPSLLDVNVHPSKLEVRFSDSEGVYYAVYHAVQNALSGKNMIVPVSIGKEEKTEKAVPAKKEALPEQFEASRLAKKEAGKTYGSEGLQRASEKLPQEVKETPDRYLASKSSSKDMVQKDAEHMVREGTSIPREALEKAAQTGNSQTQEDKIKTKEVSESGWSEQHGERKSISEEPLERKSISEEPPEAKLKAQPEEKPKQMELPNLLDKNTPKEYKILGQLFATYWLIEMEDRLFMIDQHAAHEKILFEQTMKRIRAKEMLTQLVSPPFVASLSIREEEVLKEQAEVLQQLGFTFEHFGGRDYKVTGMPADLCGLTGGELFMTLLDELVAERLHGNPQMLLEKVASMSCKAAVKGNMRLSEKEAKAMIDLLLTLDNPYHCPHGRPTTIAMSKQEIEKKFKRIV